MNTIHTLKQMFKVFERYGNFDSEEFSTQSGCIYIGGPDPEDMNQEDLEYLDNLMVFWNNQFDCWMIDT